MKWAERHSTLRTSHLTSLQQKCFVIDAGYNKRHVKHYTTTHSKSEPTDTRYRLQNNRMLDDVNNNNQVVVNIRDMSEQSLDEARFNLATHVMSNGVELIIASDKVKHSDKQAPQRLTTISSRHVQQKYPMTLAPSTLKNHMILALPTAKQENFTIPINDNQFITKTCLTTYTYHTTYVDNGSTTIESKEKVVSNRHTEERNFLRASTQLPQGVTLSNTPELVEGIFPTTYYYYNTLRNNDLVITSRYTVINTVTGPEDYISFLQPSEEATPLHDTNTYYSRLTFTKTIQDHLSLESPKILTDESVLTQVVITESIPARGSSRTQLRHESSKLDNANESDKLNVHIYATKTLLTTITYLATLKSESSSQLGARLPPSKKESDILTKFHTQVIENVITDIVPSSLLRPELVSMFRTELMQKKGKNNRKVLVTLATLVGGETLQVTAVNFPKLPPTRTHSLIDVQVSSQANVLKRNEYKATSASFNQSSIKAHHSQSKLAVTITPSTVRNNIIIETNSEITQQDSDDDTNIAESENNDVYLKPLKESQSTSPSSSTVEQLIGSLNLQRFRPVFNVMADLLQKNMINKQKPQTKQNVNNLTERKNQSSNNLEERPLYIPLQVATSGQHQINNGHNPNILANYMPKNITSDSDEELDTNIGKLTAHSLHINPPELAYPPDVLIDNNITLTYSQSSNNNRPLSHSGYQNGIPIRPGEIINANADVIIGRPNGIAPQYSRPSSHIEETSIEYRNRSANLHNVQPLKKKTWLPPPQIPLSLTPPRFIPLGGAGSSYDLERFNINKNRIAAGDDYNKILRPPLQISKPYPKFSLPSSIYLVETPPSLASLAPSPPTGTHLRPPILYNEPSYNSHLYGSQQQQQQQQISNLNSELNNNEIIEIKQIPQIFSTKLPAVTRYPIFESTHYNQIPSIPAYSAHHHINLKTDVLSHNVNMNVPPLTFKSENDHFPIATAVRGHIAPSHMPLIKIPANRANVEVRLTPLNTRIAVESPEIPEFNMQTISTFKQRYQNNLKNTDNLSMHRFTVLSPNPSLNINTIRHSTPKEMHPSDIAVKRNLSETIIKWNGQFLSDFDSGQVKSEESKRHELIYEKPNYRNTSSEDSSINVLDDEESFTQHDQKADYTTYNTKYNLANANTSLPANNPFIEVQPNVFFTKVDASIENIHRQSSNQQPKVKPRISLTAPVPVSLGQPFMKLDTSEPNKGYALLRNDNPKKLYLATGERFNLRPQLMSEFIRPIETSSQNMEHVSSFNTVKPTEILSPPPVPTFLNTAIPKTTLTYETGVKNVFKLQPPAPPTAPSVVREKSNRYPIFSTMVATKPLPQSSIVLPRFQMHLNSSSKVLANKEKSTMLKDSFSLNKPQHRNHDNATKSLRVYEKPNTSYIFMSNAPQSSASTRPILPGSTLKSIIQSSSSYKKIPSKVNILKPAIAKVSSIKPSLKPTNTWKNNTNNSFLDQNQSPVLSLESSEAVLSTGFKMQFGIADANANTVANQKAYHNKITDSLDDNTITTMVSIIFETTELEPFSSSHKETIKTISSITTPIATKISKVLITDNVRPKSKTKTKLKSKPYILTPTAAIVEKTSNPVAHSIAKSGGSVGKHLLIMPTLMTTENIRADISSILVVMTKATGNDNSNIVDLSAPLDYDSNITFEIPTRDEEIVPPLNSNSVLIGGVLIATPSKTHYTNDIDTSQHNPTCNPACKSNKNEICANKSEYGNRCECRSGFARMFPDRPCKPTYTYEMRIPTSRVGNYLLKFSDEFINNSSSQYRHLSSIILDAIDRMVMQSDFRDVYYGVQLKEFDSDKEGAIIGNFLLQLSENSEEKRLETVFKKYLRQSNYSIGGTELYTSKDGVNFFTIRDFDECGNENFNDCSTHANCFNLAGSYTCNCPDGYADISDNPIYPGRQCSDHLIGCDKCNYHGSCVTPNSNVRVIGNIGMKTVPPICECFAWYAGITCQLNLKILLICLIAIGVVFILLLACMFLIYTSRKGVHGGSAMNRPIFITASNYHPSMLTASSIRERSIEKHAILNDSNSESSHNSEQYLFKESFDVGPKKNTSRHSSSNAIYKVKDKQIRNKHNDGEAINEHSQSNLSTVDTMGHIGHMEQSDRSLTVMIPRAKYSHPTVLPHTQLLHHQMTMEKGDRNILSKASSQFNLAYNDNKTKSTSGDNGTGLDASGTDYATPNGGALVSAGFEVSAIVSDRGVELNGLAVELKENGSDPESIKGHPKQQISRKNLEAILRSGESADVRSFDETTVQAVTKSMHLCFDMQTQNNTNEEANTMTERDLGSTFLLPHTHLYKPEKLESDLSGFDSI